MATQLAYSPAAKARHSEMQLIEGVRYEISTFFFKSYETLRQKTSHFLSFCNNESQSLRNPLKLITGTTQYKVPNLYVCGLTTWRLLFKTQNSLGLESEKPSSKVCFHPRIFFAPK